MNKLWTDDAWSDYLYWSTQDKKTLKRINQILKDIDDNNRLIYKIENDNIVILHCRGHYE